MIGADFHICVEDGWLVGSRRYSRDADDQVLSSLLGNSSILVRSKMNSATLYLKG